jgi:hypothetical protein
MCRIWRVLALFLIVRAGRAFAGECPTTVVGADPTLLRLNVQTRLRFIHERLHNDARHARLWSYSWGAIYSGLAVGQFIAAPLVSHASGLDLYVGGGASLLGLAPLVLTPLTVMGDDKSIDDSQADFPEMGSCVSLAKAEKLLVRDAANEAEGRSLLFHGGNIDVNAGIFLIMGAGFGHWTSATISLLTGIATGEIMILTQPTGALDALHAYRTGDLASPADGTRIAVVPLVTRDASGVVLVMSF